MSISDWARQHLNDPISTKSDISEVEFHRRLVKRLGREPTSVEIGYIETYYIKSSWMTPETVADALLAATGNGIHRGY